jgi:hypothetical protein
MAEERKARVFYAGRRLLEVVIRQDYSLASCNHGYAEYEQTNTLVVAKGFVTVAHDEQKLKWRWDERGGWGRDVVAGDKHSKRIGRGARAKAPC